MNQKAHHSAVPFAILRKLGLVQQRKILVHVASAMVAAAAVLLVTMGVAMLIDWLATLYDSRWRFVLTGTAFFVAALTAVGWLFMVWRRLTGIERIAGDVDRYFPQLAERWTTMTRLGPDAAKPDVIHPAMLRRVATEAASWEPHVEPEQVVPLSTLMRAMLGLTAITVVLGIAVVLNSHRTLVLMARFWLPGSSISATQLVNLPGDVVVGRGEPLALAAAVKGTPVEKATLFLRSDADPSRAISLVAHGEETVEFSHRVRTVETPFEYRFRAGDGQTDWYSVGVADRPEIGKLQLTVTPPAYTRQTAKSFDKLPPRVSAMQDSEFQLALRPTIPVTSVELQLTADKQVPLTADADGWFRWNTTLKEGFTLTPILTESHGLTNRKVPKCQVTVYPDKPPAVKVVTPDDKLAVRPDDTIQITFSATDDVGIGTAELLVYDEASAIPGQEPMPISSIPIPLGDQEGARSVQQTVDLDLSKFTVEDGSELSYEIRVREDRGVSSAPSASQTATSRPAANQPAANQQASNTTASQSARSAAAGSQTSPPSASTGTSSPSQTAASQTASTSSQTASSESQSPMPPGTPSSQDGRATSDQTAASETPKSAQPSATTTAREAEEKPTATDNLASDKKSTSENQRPNSIAQSSDDKKPGAGSQAIGNGQPQPETTASTAKSSAATDETAGSQPSPSAATSKTAAAGEKTPRTASTGRQSLSGDREQPESQQTASMPKAAENSPEPAAQARESSQASSQSAQQANSEQQSQSGNQTAKSDQNQQSSPSDPPPGDSMNRRSLDIAQTSASRRMRLSVDQWAGSFEGQQRAKLEMAISPELEALEKLLEKGQKTSRGVLDELDADAKWRGTHDREVGSAERSTVDALGIVKKLQEQSKDTPYAFIGLQVADIGLAHIDPARNGFWKALESEGGDRITSVRDAWQHLGRARELVAELRGQYERARREFQLAESVERVKKMYQVYLENSQALLETQDSDPTRFNRKMVEFDLDDEYLKRLQEVMEMRRDLRAELARILAEDPRLLRRFMDSLRYRSNSLREDLAELVANQTDLNREVRAWALVDDADRPRIAKILMLRQVQDASKIATAAGELQSRYQTWLPLNRESKDADLSAATKSIQEMATAASELNSAAQQFVTDSQRVAAAAPTSPTEGEAKDQPAQSVSDGNGSTSAPPAADPQQALDSMLTDAQALYDELNKSEVALRQLAAREENAESAVFAGNRLVDTRRLIADTSAWVRQLRAHKAGNYTGAAEVDQYRLAMKTDELAGKLGAIEQTLSGLLQRRDGSLPEPIAEKAREFISTLDKQVSPNQLASVYALHSNQLPRATERQKAAGDALATAEKTYDELIRMAIEELDKLPVQDPVADLLDDPTLDELLAQLEQEAPIEELLGIPQRPSNLRIVGDWSRPGGDNALSTGGASMAMNQLRQNNQQARQRLNRAYQRAIARALKESTAKTKIEIPKATKLSDWNRLVSQLGDDLRQGRDKAPPEQYRRAIEQYFAQISGVVAENEEPSP